MTEQDLKDLGFAVSNVSKQESGDRPFRYYTYNLSKNNYKMCLISCANDELVNNQWFVSFFECNDLVYKDKEIVKKIINSILNKN